MLLHAKFSGDDGFTPPPVEKEFRDMASALGLSLWRNAGTGKFTDKATQDAYDHWKKNKGA